MTKFIYKCENCGHNTTRLHDNGHNVKLCGDCIKEPAYLNLVCKDGVLKMLDDVQ